MALRNTPQLPQTPPRTSLRNPRKTPTPTPSPARIPNTPPSKRRLYSNTVSMSTPLLVLPEHTSFEKWQDRLLSTSTCPELNELLQSEQALLYFCFRMANRQTTFDDYPFNANLQPRHIILVNHVLHYKDQFDFPFQDRDLHDRIFSALLSLRLQAAAVHPAHTDLSQMTGAEHTIDLFL